MPHELLTLSVHKVQEPYQLFHMNCARKTVGRFGNLPTVNHYCQKQLNNKNKPLHNNVAPQQTQKVARL